MAIAEGEARGSDICASLTTEGRTARTKLTMAKPRLAWKIKPESEDYDGAHRYISLLYSDAEATKLLRALREAKTSAYLAKDLLRASGLPLLPRDEPHVDADLKRIHKGKSLAPVLLIRGAMIQGISLTVADGYHRICAICYYDANAPVRCRMVSASSHLSHPRHF
jgi:hypothetical protein